MTSHLVGLMGAKRAGKDTLAAVLVEHHGFTRLAFADALKRAALDTNPYVLDLKGQVWQLDHAVALIGWDAVKEWPSARRLLVQLGIAMRTHAFADVWLAPVRAAAEALDGPVVVADVRFTNEYAWIVASGGLPVRVTREGLTDTSPDPSESMAHDPLTYPAAVTVRNRLGDLDALHAAARDIAHAARRVG